MSCSLLDRDPRETAALRALLASKIGFDPDVLGPAFLESVMRRFEHAGEMDDWRQFLQKASAGGPNWERLLQEVVVSETWFFRDQRPFEYLTDRVADRWWRHGTASRIFSCPCSTGEEPYSIAIALRESGLPDEAFHIDAADVSPDAVRRAQAARFSARSFRGAEMRNLSRYFTEDSEGRRELKPEFRRLVHFRVANLLDLASVELVPYDIVLCRNLLIYLHEDARQVVMSILRAILAEDGILIVGHAESAVPMQHGFRAVGDPGAFCFAPKAVPYTTPIQPSVRTPREQAVSEAPPSKAASVTFEEIRALADQGQVDAAVRACDLYVRQEPATAEAYYLLGVLLSARGDEGGAENALRRALYLEPDHAGALEHLALSQDLKGNTASAHRLRARVRVPAEGKAQQ